MKIKLNQWIFDAAAAAALYNKVNGFKQLTAACIEFNDLYIEAIAFLKQTRETELSTCLWLRIFFFETFIEDVKETNQCI